MKRVIVVVFLLMGLVGCDAAQVAGPELPARPSASRACDHNTEPDCVEPPPPPPGGGGHNTEGGKVYMR